MGVWVDAELVRLQGALCLYGWEQTLVVPLWLFWGSEQSSFVPHWVQASSVSASSLIYTARHPVWLCCSLSATVSLPGSSTGWSVALLNWMFSLIRLLWDRLVWFSNVTQRALHSLLFFACVSLTLSLSVVLDDPMSGLFRKPMNDDGDVYTSLLSNQSFATGREASYLSDDLKPSNHSSGSSGLDHFSSDTYSFSSNTKMTSNPTDDMPKSLMGSHKTESYNYMDISHEEDRHDQHQGVLPSAVDKGSAGHDFLGSYMDKNPGRDEDDDEEENLGPALGSHSFPYVEEPSDEELTDYRSYRNLGGTPQTASPVKITLTESQPPVFKAEPQQQPPPVSVSERESVLSVGLQGVPTVTLSEPEDDSPASTPNASPTRKHKHPPHVWIQDGQYGEKSLEVSYHFIITPAYIEVEGIFWNEVTET